MMYVAENIKVLERLKRKNPILCMKCLSPSQYGPLDLAQHLSKEEMIPMMNAMNLVITDSYEAHVPELDVVAADTLWTKVLAQLGDDAKYLEPKELEGREDYRKVCSTIVECYLLILSNKDEVAGNALRYFYRDSSVK